MERSENTVPITILICDDDASDRGAIQRALSEARVSNALRFVVDADQLLDYLYQRRSFAGETGRAPRPGLILLDLQRPRTDGKAPGTVETIDATLVDIPVVFLSTSPLNEGAARLCSLGANTSMSKPVTLGGLVGALRPLGRHWVEIVEVLPTPIPTQIHN